MTLSRILSAGALAFALGTTALTGAASAQDATLDLVGPLAQYKIYVAENTAELVANTRAFVEAIKTGDLEGAKALFAPTRTSYEAVEPIAELFSDLDVAIDARADDYEHAEEDPAFVGFHRIEYGLWVEGTTEGLEDYADKLMADVIDLNNRINALTFPPEVVVGGAAVLMEEVAATKISGEEDRYSHTDLWDFEANFAGSKVIFDLMRPLIEDDDPAFVAQVEANFQAVDDILAQYETADGGYVSYLELTDADRTVLSAKVNSLAEDLATLRARLGLG
ncbi:MAG: iron uptake system protein EfeO [Rhodospirillaceae bacterium]|nr:iron uptake system protein EfeO [Rhodospirillaceae bacterium]